MTEQQTLREIITSLNGDLEQHNTDPVTEIQEAVGYIRGYAGSLRGVTEGYSQKMEERYLLAEKLVRYKFDLPKRCTGVKH